MLTPTGWTFLSNQLGSAPFSIRYRMVSACPLLDSKSCRHQNLNHPMSPQSHLPESPQTPHLWSESAAHFSVELELSPQHGMPLVTTMWPPLHHKANAKRCCLSHNGGELVSILKPCNLERFRTSQDETPHPSDKSQKRFLKRHKWPYGPKPSSPQLRRTKRN